MPTYTPTAIVSGDPVPTNDEIFYEFLDIAEQHNYHEAGDFGSGDIPLEAVVTNRDRFVFNLVYQAELNGPVASGVVQQYFVVPFDCVVTGGYVYNMSNNSDPVIVLSREPERSSRTIFGGSGTLYADVGSRVKVFGDITLNILTPRINAGAPLISRLNMGDILSLRMTIPSGKKVSLFTYSIAAKALHTTV